MGEKGEGQDKMESQLERIIDRISEDLQKGLVSTKILEDLVGAGFSEEIAVEMVKDALGKSSGEIPKMQLLVNHAALDLKSGTTGEKVIQKLLKSGISEERAYLLTSNLQLGLKLFEKSELKEVKEPLIEGLSYLRNRGYLDAIEPLESALSILENKEEPVLLATCCMWIGVVYRNVEEYKKSLKLLKKARKLFEKEDSGIRVPFCTMNIGNVLSNLREYGKAESAYNEALEKFEEFDLYIPKARCLESIANLNTHSANYEKSVDLYRKARSIFDENGMETDLAKCNFNIADLKMKIDQYGEALQLLSESLKFFRKNKAELEVASCKVKLAEAHLNQGNLRKAQNLVKSAKEKFSDSDLQAKVGLCNKTLGNIEYYKGNYKKSLNLYEKAGTIFEKKDMHIDAAQCKKEKGNIYADFGQYEKALRLYKSAKDVFEREKVSLSLNNCRMAISSVYLNINLPVKALNLLESAKEFYENNGMDSKLSICKMNLAITFTLLIKYQKALNFYDEAQEIFEKNEQNKRVAECLYNRAGIFRELHEEVVALKQYEKARNIYNDIDASPEVAACNINIANIYRTRFDEFNKALSLCNAALREIKEKGVKELVWRGLLLKGLIREKQCKYDKGFKNFKEAIGVIEEGRSELQTEYMKSTYLQDKDLPYKEAIRTALELNNIEKAVEFAERGKSRTLIELLANRGESLRSKEAPELSEKEEELRKRIEALENSLLEEDSEDRKVDEVRVSEELEKLQGQHREIMEELQRKSPMYAATVEPAEFSLEDFREKDLFDEDWCALEYYLLDEKILIFYIDNEKEKTVSVDLTKEDLKRIKYLAEKPIIPITSDGSDEKEHSLNLDLFIPSDFKEEVLEKDLLVLAPHKALHFVPFQALEFEDGGEYLIEKIPIIYTPNLSTLELIKRKERKLEKSLIIGNPSSDLPHSEDEAKKIHDFFEKEKVSTLGPFLREDATKSVLEEKTSECDHIHIASHAYFEEENPLLSGVRLNDSSLTASEIFDLDLPCELVALSSCESRRSENLSGDELIGLTRAIFYAGAESILASLWPVEDESTSKLMTSFYQNMLEGENRAEALRNAQLDLINSENFDEPYYWGAFEIIGMI